MYISSTVPLWIIVLDNLCPFSHRLIFLKSLGTILCFPTSTSTNYEWVWLMTLAISIWYTFNNPTATTKTFIVAIVCSIAS